jgi:predicted glycogen debranching enzyme
VTREWLVTNGLGGYAAGTLGGALTRRYHGWLVAALPAPLGRIVMFNHLTEQLRIPTRTIRLGGEERLDSPLHLPGAEWLREFRLEMGMPVWCFECDGHVVERRVLMPHFQNTVHVMYRLREGAGPVRLKLRPGLHFRRHEAPVSETLPRFHLTCVDDQFELSAGSEFPSLRLFLHGEDVAFTVEGRRIQAVLYRVESSRGYEPSGDLWAPGYFRADLRPGSDVTLVASTEPWDALHALAPEAVLSAERARRERLVLAVPRPELRAGLPAELVLAADQFLVAPAGRAEEAARARAAGEEVRTVMAGYHWFTDWGRDTMISLEGLTLVTGRHQEARHILRTFGRYVRDGLIPNLFPEGENEGLYHTADATLWFFHAVERYVRITADRETLRDLLPILTAVIQHHVAGTRFGIGVDPGDGLLRQGAEGYQLTWMDAKVGDWVVTPRRGKAVEINALWYNALRTMETWLEDQDPGGTGRELGQRAEEVRRLFNERFWFHPGGHLYDVVDGPEGHDPACRPNQVFAVSLPHPVLAPERWERVLDVVRERLLTPFGLRSLAAGHPDYRPQYHGDLRARDAAYHQGTVWAWLIGPFVDGYLRVHPNDRAGARRALAGFPAHLGEACIGSISEIFDAEPPFSPRGCVAQAWSVAEVLRAWAGTEPGGIDDGRLQVDDRAGDW